MTHIALLRGINVGGKNPVKMSTIVKVFESLGFADVRTYVQSGNVVFDSGAQKTGTLTEKIGRAIETALGYAVPVIVRSAVQWKAIVDDNPLVGVQGVDEEKLHVTFLSKGPADVDEKRFNTYLRAGELVRIMGQEVYLHCPLGYGTTKLTNQLFEKMLSVGATTRNWRTVKALVEMSIGS